MNDKELMNYVPNVEFRLVPCNTIRTDVAYQRERSDRFVARVASDFDKNLLKPIKVSERDSQLYCIDGQHSLEIVKTASGREDALVWCMIYKGLTYENEAYLFSKQQQYEKSLLSYNITNAKIEAKDPDALMIDRILSSYGFSISDRIGDYRIKATKVLERVYSEFGPECLAKVLLLIKETWNGNREYLRSAFILAIAKMVVIYDLNEDAFISRFKTTTMDEIVFEAKNCSYGSKKDYLRALVNIYNKRGGKRLNLELLSQTKLSVNNKNC